MKPTLHSIVFKFTINRLRNYIMSDAGIYDLSDNYKYKKIGCIDFSYLNPCGVEILHFLGRYNVTVSTISYLANNTKNTLHNIAD